MAILLGNYNFTYIKDNPKVHMIAKRIDKTLSPYSVQIYSAPLAELDKSVRNVHLGFLYREHAQTVMSTLGENCYLIDEELSFWREYSSVTKTPLAILTDGYCDLQDKKEIWEISYNLP
jgi:hypothetical protein